MSNIKRLKTNFTIVANTWLKDKNLSAKAKGIICFLQSVSDDWEYSIRGLATQFNDGEESIRSGVKELVDAGYITWTRQRNEKGQVTGNDVYLHEKPVKQEKTCSGKSLIGGNSTNKEKSVNKIQKNIDNTNVLSMATPTETVASKEVATYGNASINEAFNLWQKQLGYPLKASTQNRRAVWNMLRAKDKGAEWLTKMLALLAEAKKDRYSGIRIANFADLQRDWEKLLAWGSSQYAQQHGTTTQDKEFDNLVSQL